MNPEKPQTQRYLFPVCLMVLVAWISGTPGPQLGSMHFVGLDKIGHFIVFGLISLSLYRSMTLKLKQMDKVTLAILLTSAFGFSDELHQYTNPDRFFEWNDMLANFTGATVMTCIYALSSSARDLLEWNFPIPSKQSVR